MHNPALMLISASVIKSKLAAEAVDFTVHAVFEAARDDIFVDEIEQALCECEIIADFPQRGRCLVWGRLPSGEPVHVVVEYADYAGDPEAHLVVVTVYRPDPERWIDGRMRRD